MPVLHPSIVSIARRIRCAMLRMLSGRCFRYDLRRFLRYACPYRPDARETLATRIVMDYHVVEKGLTMPARRMGFGQERVQVLLSRLRSFELAYGCADFHVRHAISVVRAYAELHRCWEGKTESPDFWKKVDVFSAAHQNIPPAIQLHFTKDEFFADLDKPFPVFAASRHTVRHYALSALPMERIRAAVRLASMAPCACNRQYVRVHCVSGKDQITPLLELQGGNRGFGHLADKLLIVTADLRGLVAERERNDLFTNGGIFLMNLSYALHSQRIAHCILNWSKSPDDDCILRQLITLNDSESVIAFLTCGEAPDEFDVASSPRKPLHDILVEHNCAGQ